MLRLDVIETSGLNAVNKVFPAKPGVSKCGPLRVFGVAEEDDVADLSYLHAATPVAERGDLP